MKKGYFALSREIFSHWTFKDPEKLKAFIDLQGLAAWEAGIECINGRMIEVEIGEKVTARSFLSHRWGWGGQKVRSFLDNLENSGDISRRNNQGITVLKLGKHWLLERRGSEEQPSDNQLITSKPTSWQPDESQENNQMKEGSNPQGLKDLDGVESEKQPDENQLEDPKITSRFPKDNHKSKDEVINKNIVKNISPSAPPASPKIASKVSASEVEEIWSHYGNKTGGRKAKKKVGEAIAAVGVEKLKAGIDTYNKHLSENPWKSKRNPSTYFENEGWDDEYPQSNRPNGKASKPPIKEPPLSMVKAAYAAAWPKEDCPNIAAFDSSMTYQQFSDEDRYKLSESHPPLQAFLSK